MNIERYLWMLPFLSFLSGYLFLAWLHNPSVMQTPSLIGLNLTDAASILSDQQLNLRIIAKKTDNDLPDGTIINQSPSTQQKIKQQQTVFCAISHQANDYTIPQLTQIGHKSRTELLELHHMRAKIFSLYSIYPKGYCFAQFPEAHQQFKEKTIILYESAGTHPLVLFPDCRSKNVQEVTEFLALHQFNVQVFHTQPVSPSHECTKCIVVNQKPLAGSIIDSSKPITVQIQGAPAL